MYHRNPSSMAGRRLFRGGYGQMRNWPRSLLIAVTAVMVPAAMQAQAYRAPRTADGKPNLNGIWQAMNTANWDVRPHAAAQGPALALGAQFSIPPGIGVVEGDEIPYLPAAAAKQKENFAKRMTL